MVTRAPHQEEDPESMDAFYRKRGDTENRIKDLNNALKADRTRCHRFAANFFRLLKQALAYVLMDPLRRSTTSPGVQRMQLGLYLAKVFVETARFLAIPIPA